MKRLYNICIIIHRKRDFDVLRAEKDATMKEAVQAAREVSDIDKVEILKSQLLITLTT
jgi:hypothetical protein